MTRLEVEPTQLDAFRAAFHDAATPLTVSDGFCTTVLLTDLGSGRAVVETIWRDREALVAARGATADRRLQAVSSGTATVRGIEQYRLYFHSVELE